MLFESGPDCEVRFQLDAPIASDDESLDRLDRAIFLDDEPHLRWRN